MPVLVYLSYSSDRVSDEQGVRYPNDTWPNRPIARGEERKWPLREDPPADRMPEVTEFSIDTTLRLDLGKKTLVGGSSADSSTYLAISVK